MNLHICKNPFELNDRGAVSVPFFCFMTLYSKTLTSPQV